MPDYNELLNPPVAKPNTLGLDPSVINALGARDMRFQEKRLSDIQDQMNKPKSYKMNINDNIYDVPIQHVPSFLKLGYEVQGIEARTQASQASTAKTKLEMDQIPGEVKRKRESTDSLIKSRDDTTRIKDATLGIRQSELALKTASDKRAQRVAEDNIQKNKIDLVNIISNVRGDEKPETQLEAMKFYNETASEADPLYYWEPDNPGWFTGGANAPIAINPAEIPTVPGVTPFTHKEIRQIANEEGWSVSDTINYLIKGPQK